MNTVSAVVVAVCLVCVKYHHTLNQMIPNLTSGHADEAKRHNIQVDLYVV